MANNKRGIFNKGLHRHKKMHNMSLEMKMKNGGDGKRCRKVNTNTSPPPTATYCNWKSGRDLRRACFLLLLVVTLSLNIASTLASCNPPRIINGKVQVKDIPHNGKYSDNSEAIVSCEPGYHLKSGEVIYCQNNKWVASGSRVMEDQLCGKSKSLYYTARADYVEHTMFQLTFKVIHWEITQVRK